MIPGLAGMPSLSLADTTQQTSSGTLTNVFAPQHSFSLSGITGQSSTPTVTPPGQPASALGGNNILIIAAAVALVAVVMIYKT